MVSGAAKPTSRKNNFSPKQIYPKCISVLHSLLLRWHCLSSVCRRICHRRFCICTSRVARLLCTTEADNRRLIGCPLRSFHASEKSCGVPFKARRHPALCHLSSLLLCDALSISVWAIEHCICIHNCCQTSNPASCLACQRVWTCCFPMQSV